MTEIENSLTRHSLCTFAGGARGVCLQVTSLDQDGCIQLTMEEAAELCNHLAEFVEEEAKRRQSLLKEQIRDLKDAEKTVFHEIAELRPESFRIPRLVIGLISSLCPTK